MIIQAELDEIKIKAGLNQSRAMEELAFSCIDLTTLNATDTRNYVRIFTSRVNDFGNDYPSLPNVAAVCVYPNMVQSVKETLNQDKVRIAAVAGGFPASMTFIGLKVEEARMAVELGADEVDIVLPLWAFMEGDLTTCREEIGTIKKAIGEAHLKVILETGILGEPEKIYKASMLAMESGADFIKTSTGKVSPAATPGAAYVMCQAIREFHSRTGHRVGFKPAGGIATTGDAILYLTIVREVLGETWMNPELFRIGASRLANHLLGDILNEEISYF
jgi:deoxyribose-phosphate aldolase